MKMSYISVHEFTQLRAAVHQNPGWYEGLLSCSPQELEELPEVHLVLELINARSTYDDLVSYGSRIVGDVSIDPIDLVQNLIYKIYIGKGLPKWPTTDCKVLANFKSIIKNQVTDSYRRRSMHQKHTPGIKFVERDRRSRNHKYDPIDADFLLEVIGLALDRLPAASVELLLQPLLGLCTQEKLAKQHRTSSATISRRRQLVLKTLRKAVTEVYDAIP